MEKQYIFQYREMLILIWVFQVGYKVIFNTSVWVLRSRYAHYVSLNSNLLHLHVQRIMFLYKFRIPYIKYDTIMKI